MPARKRAPRKTIEELMPADLPRYMVPAWLSGLSWAIGDEGAREEFRKATGLVWRPATSPLERMIDDATGAGDAYIVAFIGWFNVEVWGSLGGAIVDDLGLYPEGGSDVSGE